MKVIGVIPARWNSSRFPGKPLVNLLGKSLIQRTYENALRSQSLNRLIVATDDLRIARHAQDFGAEVMVTSPACPTGTDRVAEVIARLDSPADIVVNIQGDEPCLDPSVIDALVVRLVETPEAHMTTPVCLISDPDAVHSPHVTKCVFDRMGRALYFSRSAIPYGRHKANYYRHLGVYCFRRPFLEHYILLNQTDLQKIEDLEMLKVLENGFAVHVCLVEDQTIGVDTPEDIQTVESYLCQLQKENMYS